MVTGRFLACVLAGAMAGCGGGSDPSDPSTVNAAATDATVRVEPTVYALLTAADVGGLEIADVNDRGEVLGIGRSAEGGDIYGIWGGGSVRMIPESECNNDGFPCPRAVGFNKPSQVLLAVTSRLGWTSLAVWQDGAYTKLGCGLQGPMNDADLVLSPQLCEEPNETGPGIIKISTGGRTPLVAGFSPLGLNNSATLIGIQASATAGGTPQAVTISSTGQLTVLDRQGHASALPRAINDAGVVVGTVNSEAAPTADAPGHPRPASWQGGQRTDLPCPGQDGQALDVNTAGVIAGTCTQTDGSSRAVLWSDGVALDLNGALKPEVASAWRLTSARKLTDQGWVLAQAVRVGDATTETTVLLKPQ